jgi:hypothetical protein
MPPGCGDDCYAGETLGALMHFLIAGFLATLGMLAAVTAAPTIFAIAVGAVKALGVFLLVGFVAAVFWLKRR